MTTEAIAPVVPPPVAVAEDQPQSAGTEAVVTIDSIATKPEAPPEIVSASPAEVLMPVSGMATFTLGNVADKAGDAKVRSDLDLAQIVSGIGQTSRRFSEFCTIYRPYILEARDRFKQKSRRVPVEGNPTWTEFVKQTFGVTVRYVRLLLQEHSRPDRKSATSKSPSASATSNLTGTERSTAEEIDNHDGTHLIALYLEDKKYNRLKRAEEGLRPLLKTRDRWTATDTYYEAIVAYAICQDVNLDGENHTTETEEAGNEKATA